MTNDQARMTKLPPVILSAAKDPSSIARAALERAAPRAGIAASQAHPGTGAPIPRRTGSSPASPRAMDERSFAALRMTRWRCDAPAGHWALVIDWSLGFGHWCFARRGFTRGGAA